MATPILARRFSIYSSVREQECGVQLIAQGTFSDHRMKIDVSAVFDRDYHFLTANFSASAGYPANALKYFLTLHAVQSEEDDSEILRQSSVGEKSQVIQSIT